MPLDKFRAANLANWDDRVPIHLKAKTVYDVDGFIADPERISPTVEFDRHQLGDVSGKSLLHLQCHIGHDTLSWARLGATVTGVDFSEPAVADALYGELGLAPGLAAMTDVYYSRPVADFVSDQAIAALNPLSGSGLSAAQTGISGTGSLSGINATLGAYALTLPGPVQGALLSMLG